MSDELTISGGGVSMVGTATLFVTADLLELGSAEFRGCLAQLLGIERRWTAAAEPQAAASAHRALEEAATLLRRCAQRSAELAKDLRTAAARYSEAEREATRFSQGLSAMAGYGLGLLASLTIPFALPGVLAITGVAAAVNTSPRKEFTLVRDRLAAWIISNRTLLSRPATVAAVRMLVMSSDDFGLGLVRADPVSAILLGDEGSSTVGLEGMALLCLLAGSAAGLFAGTPVAVGTRRQADGSAALSAGDRAKNIPGADPGDPQIRIDRISIRGAADRFEVYLGGTIDFSAKTADEPFDLTSDLAGIAGADSGAYRSVREAMAQAGITSESQVVFNGYSLGALVAARLAASGDYDTQGLFTLGGPVGRVALPEGIVWLAVQHSDDLVPALGGTWSDPAAVVVERQVFADRPLDTSVAIPAHWLPRYQETARLIDGVSEQRVTEALGRLAEFDRGADRVVSTWYRADRVGAVSENRSRTGLQ
ncbi:MAG: alpha/beta hydrolase family protein [Microbacteriaceae bacterium]